MKKHKQLRDPWGILMRTKMFMENFHGQVSGAIARKYTKDIELFMWSEVVLKIRDKLNPEGKIK